MTMARRSWDFSAISCAPSLQILQAYGFFAAVAIGLSVA